MPPAEDACISSMVQWHPVHENRKIQKSSMGTLRDRVGVGVRARVNVEGVRVRAAAAARVLRGPLARCGRARRATWSGCAALPSLRAARGRCARGCRRAP
eukprot:scaffold29507_cov36-Phaeocystis_antarctica.AAC.1